MSPTYLEAKELLPGDISRETSSLYTPLALLKLKQPSQKEVYTLIWNPNFCNCCPEKTYGSPGQEANRD